MQKYLIACLLALVGPLSVAGDSFEDIYPHTPTVKYFTVPLDHYTYTDRTNRETF